MISIDTNVLVRLFTADDKKQADKAIRLFRKKQIYITRTVILETEWVLRYAYKFSVDEIADAFTKLLGQENVTVEDVRHIALAIGLLRQGIDFADAIHLICSQQYPFVTFDKKLQTKASAAGLDSVTLLE